MTAATSGHWAAYTRFMETIGLVRAGDPEARPGRRGLIVVGTGIAMVALAPLAWWLAGWPFWLAPLFPIGLILIIAPIQTARRCAQQRRNRAVLTAWGEPRGLAYKARVPKLATTPLLMRRGVIAPALIGSIGGDPQGILAHYTFWVPSGESQRAVKVSLALAGFAGLDGLRIVIRDGDPLKMGGAFDDWSSFDTESAAVNERFEIEVREGHDPAQITELLDPMTLVSLLEGDRDLMIEIDQGTLVVAIRGHVGIDPGVEDLNWFDVLRARADEWGARIAGI